MYGSVMSVIPKAFPQGWAFFTKSARESRLSVWNRDPLDSSKWTDSLGGSAAEFHNGFGLSRNRRAQGPEISIILKSLLNKDGVWVKCRGTVEECLTQNAQSTPIAQNGRRDPTLCGIHYFVRTEVIPWAWANLHAKAEHSIRGADIKCTLTAS